MGWYLLKLAIMLPLLALAIWGCLALAKKMQARLGGGNGAPGKARAARLVETTFVAPGIRLAVVEFRGKEILIGSSKQGLTRLAEADRPATSGAGQ